jgi:hydrogenase expression/formation protein HypE
MAAFDEQFGKVDAQVFKEDLLHKCGAKREEVICGPRFGVDTAIIDLGNGNALATSSDPLSLIPSLGMEISAHLSVHLLANDMSTTGFAPQFAQFVLNLPVSLSREDFNLYWGHIDALCKKLGISITGGHTGQIPGQESTISGGGTMFLQAPKQKILSSNNAEVGDSIIMTKHAALSSSSLLANAFPKTVSEKCGEETQKIAANNFWHLSVMKEALLASSILKPNQELHAMHDVTEGGILGALDEMADASGCGFTVELDKINLNEEVRQITDLFEIDPFLSIGAGSMLMAVKPGNEDRLIEGLSKEGVEACKIGVFTEGSSKQLVEKNGEQRSFTFDGVDPYWAAFFKAFQAGWQ